MAIIFDCVDGEVATLVLDSCSGRAMENERENGGLGVKARGK